MAIAKLVCRNVGPMYRHDCESCKFVGRLDDRDIYVCFEDSTFVVRFGSRPGENGAHAAIHPPEPGSIYALARALVDRDEAPAAYITG